MNKRNALAVGTMLTVALAYSSGCADAPPDSIPAFGPTGSSVSTGAGGGSTTSTGAGAGDMDAQGFYDTQVHEAMMTECGSCHSPGGQGPTWLDDGADAASTYAVMEAYNSLLQPAECSLLMLKSKGAHAGPAFSATLESAVGQWLGREATERSLTCDGGGNIGSCDQAITAFQDCMDIDHWDAMGMGELSRQQVAGGGACYTCHTSGNGQALLALDSLDTFDAHKNDKYFLQKLVTCSISQGQFQGLTQSMRYVNKGLEGCVTGPNQPCHPDFVLTPERESSVNDYVSDVLDAMQNNTCDQLAPPP
jgi:hypothetical protein